jgi:hypothetical protein
VVGVKVIMVREWTPKRGERERERERDKGGRRRRSWGGERD